MIPAALLILLEAVVRALIAACVLGVMLRLLRVKNVPAQKAAWGLVLMAALTMPLLMHWQGLPSWAAVKLPAPFWTRTSDSGPHPVSVPATATSPVNAPESKSQSVSKVDNRYDLPAISDSEFPVSKSSIAGTPATPRPAAARLASKPAPKNLLPRIFAFAWLAYLGVGAALLLRLFIGLASSLRIWIRAKPVDALHTSNIPAHVSVRSSHRVASPVNIGSGILLPSGYTAWDDEKLRVVLAHEHAHIKQRDYYLQLLAGLYAACTWFSPLGWWLKRKLSELGEAISDHAGLEAAASPSAYAELLLEFAALPRPTLSGVAMANSSNLSQRIERLLNESSFQKTFAGGRRALVTLLVPAVLIAAASLIRVQAAAIPSQAAPSQAAKSSPDQPPAPPAITGQSHLDSDPATIADPAPAPQHSAPEAAQAAPAPAPVPSPAPAPAAAPVAPASPMLDASMQEPAPVAAPIPRVHVEVRMPPIDIQMSNFAPDGEIYAIVGDPGSNTSFHGKWDVNGHAEVEKARKIATGHFLLFRRDGKSYIVDDPEIVHPIEDMDRTVQQESASMRALGQQMRDAGRGFHDQMHDVNEQARQIARQAQEASVQIPTPDITKEMAELNAAVAALQAKQGGTISRDQLNEIQQKITEVQRRVIDAEVKVNLKVNLDMSRFKDAQSKFNEEQSRLSAQMGQAGADMGRTIRENNEKLKSFIDDSLKNGKARPVN